MTPPSPLEGKNLFHYELKGEANEEVRAQLDSNQAFPDLTLDGEWNPAGYRQLVTELMAAQYEADPSYEESVSHCHREEHRIPIRDGNNAEVRVWTYRPHALKGDHASPAIVYVHGGGSVGGCLEDFIPLCSRMAVDTGTVVCAVGYRMVPFVEFPYTMLDTYAATRHITENAGELGIDPGRIALSGDSAGSYQVLATVAKLAQEGHADSIKLARISVAQIFDYFFTEPVSEMKQVEIDTIQESQAVMDWMTGGQTQPHLDNKNPLLFPGLATDELLSAYPPFLILEEEFDNYRTPAERLAQRLKKAGRLLEYVCYPGTAHNGGHPNSRSDLVLMFDEYLK
jgi:acetyl esterase